MANALLMLVHFKAVQLLTTCRRPPLNLDLTCTKDTQGYLEASKKRDKGTSGNLATFRNLFCNLLQPLPATPNSGTTCVQLIRRYGSGSRCWFSTAGEIIAIQMGLYGVLKTTFADILGHVSGQ